MISKIKSILAFFLLVVLVGCTQKSETYKDQAMIEKVLPTNLNPKNYDIIGFACGEGGEASNLVRDFTKLLTHKKYKQIRRDLYNPSTGIMYLATISCDKLAKRGLVKLNAAESRQLAKNLKSSDSISTCSGCTVSGNYAVKQLIHDTSNSMREEAEWWLDQVLGL
ncbi:MAG: hypothetical protein RIT43_2299 [Bacteroidota bacterium]|jgi:hypothetical protein